MRLAGRSAGWLLAGIFLCLMVICPLNFAHGQTGSESSSSEASIPANGANKAPEGLAQESREAAGEEDQTAQFKQSASVKMVARLTGLSLHGAYLLCLVLNFAIVAGVILFFVKKNVPGALRNRTAQIQQAMEEARKASADANQRLAEIGARLSKLGSEIAEMRDAAEREAAAEAVRMKAAAEEEARKIVQNAEQEIAAAAKSARRELTAYAASLAVSLASKQIHVDQPTDESLVRDFAGQLLGDGKTRGGGN